MTNEEKAMEIAANHKMTYLALENDGSVYDVDSYDECLASAMEMAKWKEEQMIEKACEWLLSNAHKYQMYDAIEDNEWYDKKQLILDFKKVMGE